MPLDSITARTAPHLLSISAVEIGLLMRSDIGVMATTPEQLLFISILFLLTQKRNLITVIIQTPR